MRGLLFVSSIIAAVCLGGCAKQLAEVHQTWDVITGASVSPQAVVIAVNTLDGLEVTAANYLRLPICSGKTWTACRNPKATIPLKKAMTAAQIARNNLEAFQRANPGALGPSGLFQALQDAVSTLQAVITEYNIAG